MLTATRTSHRAALRLGPPAGGLGGAPLGWGHMHGEGVVCVLQAQRDVLLPCRTGQAWPGGARPGDGGLTTPTRGCAQSPWALIAHR